LRLPMSSSGISVKLYRENSGAQQPAAHLSLAKTGLPRAERAALPWPRALASNVQPPLAGQL
jgi:hypothetical protein